MGAVACSHGCFVCGPHIERYGHSGECCHSTECDPYRWEYQVKNWLRAEKEHNYRLWLVVEKDYNERWCAAEEAWKQELRSRSKVRIKAVPRQPNDPSKQREAASRHKQAAQ